ncbi:MAG: hypothetical protein R3F18_06730 [Lysobacterales bacterium]
MAQEHRISQTGRHRHQHAQRLTAGRIAPQLGQDALGVGGIQIAKPGGSFSVARAEGKAPAVLEAQ